MTTDSDAQARLKLGTAILESDGAVNVASVPQLSPFRYAGGKTWLTPWIRLWLRSTAPRPTTLVDVFAGGGSVSLAAVFENLVKQAILIELDENVASVWETIKHGDGSKLAEKILKFNCTADSVAELLSLTPRNEEERAFRTLVMNRTRYGGIIAPGAAPVKRGENDRGISSRWYPETLDRRIRAISEKRDKIIIIPGNGMQFLERARRHKNVVFYIDPPYTIAGRRLYSHTDIDHEKLFYLAGRLHGDILMTYDNADQIRNLARRFEFQVKEIPMRSTKHELKHELLVGRNLEWVRAPS